VPQTTFDGVNSRLRSTVEVLDLSARADFRTMSATGTLSPTYPDTLLAVDSSGGARVITLPDPLTVPGFRVTIVRDGGSLVSVTDGTTTWRIIEDGDALEVTSSGVAWVPSSHYLPRGGRYDVRAAAITADTTISLTFPFTHIDVDSTSAAVTLTLPALASVQGYVLTVSKIVAANTVTLDPNGSEKVNTSSNLAWSARWTTYSLLARADEWRIVSSYI
jgi:hypothetical protein